METEKNNTKLNWTALEFLHYPKNQWWFVAVAAAGLGLATYFSLKKDFLTAVLFLLLLALILYFGKMRPKMVEIELDRSGLKINKIRFPYQQLKSFWIVYEPPMVKTLNFETTARLNRYLTLQLADEDPVKIRDFLLQFLPEDLEKGEQFADKLSRTLKF